MAGISPPCRSTHSAWCCSIRNRHVGRSRQQPHRVRGWESWSPDSRFVSYEEGTEIRRIRIADRQTETVANTKNLDRLYGFVGSWIGFTPDGSPMVLLDVGTHDIYALDWDAP
jgi:hypothetical protein